MKKRCIWLTKGRRNLQWRCKAPFKPYLIRYLCSPLGWSFTAHTNKAACCPLLIKSRCLLMHLNTHFIFSTFHLSTTHSYHFLNVVYKKRKSRPNECSPERTEALTPNGCVSSAKPLMDDANYQRLTGPHKRSRSICHVACCTHLKMSDNDSRLKHGHHQKSTLHRCDGET